MFFLEHGFSLFLGIMQSTLYKVWKHKFSVCSTNHLIIKTILEDTINIDPLWTLGREFLPQNVQYAHSWEIDITSHSNQAKTILYFLIGFLWDEPL